jgi:O-antigen ligase
VPPLGSLLHAAATAAVGARVAACAPSGDAEGDAPQAFEPFAWAVLAAGVLSALVSVVQYFFPHWADGNFIAVSGLPGRAVGNLRQPNHLASLLIWAGIALVPLAEWRRIPRWATYLVGALLVFGVLLSGSRTGLYAGVGLLMLWGLADWALESAGLAEGRLSTGTRWMLIAAPLVAVVLWWGLDYYATTTQHVFGAKERLAEKDVTSSHGAIWKNTLVMIRQQPWTGVGWGEFNFAWTLTPFPDRPTAFFDHTHNLPLQLAVELGLPLSGLVMLLLLITLWQGMLRAWRTTGAAGHGARAAWVMVVMIGIHSLDEYPLWYVYFLLPAAWAWGFTLGSGPAPKPAAPPVLHGTAGSSRLFRDTSETTIIRLSGDGAGLRWTGVLMLAVAIAASYDYWRVSTIFAELDDPPLATRILSGQRSLLFAHHADYADATTAEPPSRALGALERATHSLLDARLMMAWANALAESGQLDRARYVAARLREFHKPDAEEFFAPCSNAVALKESAEAASAAKAGAGASPPGSAKEQAIPFQCQEPGTKLTWRDFH